MTSVIPMEAFAARSPGRANGAPSVDFIDGGGHVQATPQ